MDLVRLKSELHDQINHRYDQVLFFNLGPTEGKGSDSTTALGIPYLAPKRGPYII